MSTAESRPRISFIEDRVYNEINDFQEDFENDERSEKEIPVWDTFKSYPRKSKKGSMQENKCLDSTIKLMKILAYIFCFLVTLIAGVSSVMAILFAVAQLKEERLVRYCNSNFESAGHIVATASKSSKIIWMWAILAMLLIPECLSLISAFWISLFRRNVQKTKKLTICYLILLEAFSSLGFVLLLFFGLKTLDSVEAIGIGFCFCLGPAVLKLLSRNKGSRSPRMFTTVLICDVLAMIGQLSGLIYSIVVQKDKSSFECWSLPLGMILASTRYWGNFLKRGSHFGLIRHLHRHQKLLQHSRQLIKPELCLFRVIFLFLTSILSVHLSQIEVSDFFSTLLTSSTEITINIYSNASVLVLPFPETGTFYEKLNSNSAEILNVSVTNWMPFLAVLIQFLCGFVVYQIAKFTFRTHMNGFGLALPIVLVGPAALILLISLFVARENDSCALNSWFPDFLFFEKPISSLNSQSYFTNHRLYLWTLWSLSQFWIIKHIFHANCEKLAKIDAIFSCTNWDNSFINFFLPLNIRKKEEDSQLVGEKDIETEIQIPDLAEVTINPSTAPSAIIIDSIVENSKIGSQQDSNFSNTKIYACATMWHEEKSEMRELIESILRMDRDQCAMRVTQKYYGVQIRDYYELETHIFFDDAFRCLHNCVKDCPHSDTESQVNQYVIDFLEIMETTIESHNVRYSQPIKYPTPFGGRFVWRLPGGTELVVHLKDKNRIRHRKRWSQVMYMYYLLGYRLMGSPLSALEKEQVAENTFILTLDGDIDFKPEAVKVLLDLMKKNKDLGAACGRIHPVGRGPMIWFQKFEYAVGHWLQKSTEHIVGSVLCSPGCFSLFRAKSLMRNNVMAKYASRSTEPRHYIQYDQGEDRWLCTLILQSGCRVEYSAASDAYTHAPEKFRDFFIQRRRWIPSTVANIFDLLKTAKETRKLNSDISLIYIVYQWCLMGSTILGPGTIFLMMVGAAATAFHISNWTSFTYNLLPLLFFILICLFFKEKTQLLFAEVISIIYSLVMVVVFVGIIMQIAEDGLLSPTTLLFFIIAAQFVITGLLHPKEWTCLFCGLVYYVLVPSMYMILIIYSIFNLHNVSWGTREKKSRALEMAEQLEEEQENAELDRVKGKHKGKLEFTVATLLKCSFCLYREQTDNEKKLNEIQETLATVMEKLEAIERTSDQNPEAEEYLNSIPESNTHPYPNEPPERKNPEADNILNRSDYLVSPCWLKDDRIKNGEVDFLSNSEEEFWKMLIDKYLYPIDNDSDKQKEISEQLLSLRNEYLIKFFLINALFVLIVFLMQLNKDTLHLKWPLDYRCKVTFESINRVIIEKEYLKLEPIGCLFIAGFVTILIIQFLAMLVHRFDTFSHILANTNLHFPCSKKYESEEISLEKHAEDIAIDLQRMVEREIRYGCRDNSTAFKANGGKVLSGFESVFKKKLNEPNFKGIPQILYSKLPLKALEAFRRRRTEVLSKKEVPEETYDNPGFQF